jgi:hypothetical protein
VKGQLSTMLHRLGAGDRPHPLGIDVRQANARTGAKAGARSFDAPKEPRIALQPVLEPLVFRFEADQHAGGLAVPRDDVLPRLGFAQKAREIVLHLR